MLSNATCFLKGLGFHPHVTAYAVQLSRKNEVIRARNLLGFRVY
jgi:hypothetical protein